MPARIIESLGSADGLTTKALFEFEDMRTAETVRILRPDKSIICFSTMVGCPIGCGFCVSGKPGMYRRPLTYNEMFDMVWHMHANYAERSSWVFSAMGEGEPALNIDAVIDTFAELRLKIGPCKFALSTTGPSPKVMANLLQRIEENNLLDIKLQYSLHATDSVRRRLIPSSKLDERVALRMIAKTNIKCEVNVVLMKGKNDSLNQLKNLSFILSETKRADGKPWKVKINRYNVVEGLSVEPAHNEVVALFCDILADAGHDFEYYETDGSDIAAACGQLHHRYEVRANG